MKDILGNPNLLNNFAKIDDAEIHVCIKYWSKESDFILSELCNMLINRRLLKIKIQKTRFSKNEIHDLINKMNQKYNCTKQEAKYFIFSNKVSNSAYNIEDTNINILMKNGDIVDIASASDQFNIKSLSKKVEKYFLCYPETIL